MPLDQDALNALRIERHPPPATRNTRTLWISSLVTATVCITLIALVLNVHKPLEVETFTVTATQTGDTVVLDASGYVVARRQATVSSKVTGRVKAVFIEEGMRVKTGQLLAQLDDSSAQPQLDLAQRQAEAATKNLAEVQVRLNEAQRALQRATQLRADKLISEAELDTAQSTVAALHAQLDALKSAITVATATVRVQQQNMDDLLIRAPFAGVVISKDAQPGEVISPISAGGGFTRTGIATIVDMDSREVEVDVNEAFINRVYDAQPTEATLDAYPDWAIPSHVISIVPAADRQKATVRVRIGFDQLDPRILPDMGIKVRFLANDANVRTSPTAVIPNSALFQENNTTYVWRINNQQLEQVAVRTGNLHNDHVEIISGVNTGDIIVTTALPELKKNKKIHVIEK